MGIRHFIPLLVLSKANPLALGFAWVPVWAGLWAAYALLRC